MSPTGLRLFALMPALLGLLFCLGDRYTVAGRIIFGCYCAAFVATACAAIADRRAERVRAQGAAQQNPDRHNGSR